MHLARSFLTIASCIPGHCVLALYHTSSERLATQREAPGLAPDNPAVGSWSALVNMPLAYSSSSSSLITASNTEIRWPFLREGAPDVIIHKPHKDDVYEWVMMPLIFTLGQAFADLGANVAYTYPEHSDLILATAAERARTQPGARRLVVILFEVFHGYDNGTVETINRVADTAFMVLYSTEACQPIPGELWNTRSYGPRIDERWDYSYANIECLHRNGFEYPIRYVPPGFTHLFDMGLDLESPDRDLGKVAFMGRWSDKGGRPKWKRDAYEAILGESLTVLEGCDTPQEVHDYVARYPVQLNVHRLPKEEAVQYLEVFRFAELVANGACVISEPSEDARDNTDWGGIIHFANVEGTAAELEKVRGNVQACQEEAYAGFRARFQPVDLLRKSGFVREWWDLHSNP